MRAGLLAALGCTLAVTALAGRARAQDVSLRDGELAVFGRYPVAGAPFTIGASFVTTLDELPVSFAAELAPLAEGGGVSVGLRPSLLRYVDYELVWASELGAIAYGLDGASVGLAASTRLLNVIHADPVAFAVTPRVDFAGVGGDQAGWRLRTTLVLALGMVLPEGAAWIEGEVGYVFDGESAGAFVMSLGLVLSLRPASL